MGEPNPAASTPKKITSSESAGPEHRKPVQKSKRAEAPKQEGTQAASLAAMEQTDKATSTNEAQALRNYIATQMENNALNRQRAELEPDTAPEIFKAPMGETIWKMRGTATGLLNTAYVALGTKYDLDYGEPTPQPISVEFPIAEIPAYILKQMEGVIYYLGADTEGATVTVSGQRVDISGGGNKFIVKMETPNRSIQVTKYEGYRLNRSEPEKDNEMVIVSKDGDKTRTITFREGGSGEETESVANLIDLRETKQEMKNKKGKTTGTTTSIVAYTHDQRGDIKESYFGVKMQDNKGKTTGSWPAPKEAESRMPMTHGRPDKSLVALFPRVQVQRPVK